MSKIRLATLLDAEKVAEIYRHYVLNTAISFEEVAPDGEEMRARISQVLAEFPWLVYTQNSEVVGYAYAHPWKNRSAYNWSVESSVYVSEGWHRRGIGTALYAALLNRLESQGIVNVFGGIALPNPASVALHEFFGFKPVAELKDVGYKMGKWWNVGYWQLQFRKPEIPTPPTKRPI